MTMRGADHLRISEDMPERDDTKLILGIIASARARQENLKNEEDPVLEDLLAQRRKIDQAISDLKGEKKTNVNMIGDLIAEHEEELIADLLDPGYQIDPMMRAALLAPILGGEGLRGEMVQRSAYAVGEQLSDLNNLQINSNNPQQFLVMTYRPSRIPGWYEDLHISFGLTTPGVSLKPRAEEQIGDRHVDNSVTANMIDLPVRGFMAIKPSLYNHEYFTSNEDLVSVNGYRTKRAVANTGHWFKSGKNSIILPTGNIFTEGAEPIAKYDDQEGNVKEVRLGSRSLGITDERSLCAIGDNAVRDVRRELLAGAYRIYDDNEDMRKMFHDVDGQVVNGFRRLSGITTIRRNHGLQPL